MKKPFKSDKNGSPNGAVSPKETGTLVSPTGSFRDTMRDNLSGRAPSTPEGASLASALGMWGGGNESDAFELFEIPTDFTDFHELRRLVAKSDVPAEMVQPLMVILALAERYDSKVIPSLVGWFLVGRIGKNRLGRREFIKASQKAAVTGEEED